MVHSYKSSGPFERLAQHCPAQRSRLWRRGRVVDAQRATRQVRPQGGAVFLVLLQPEDLSGVVVEPLQRWRHAAAERVQMLQPGHLAIGQLGQRLVHSSQLLAGL